MVKRLKSDQPHTNLVTDIFQRLGIYSQSLILQFQKQYGGIMGQLVK